MSSTQELVREAAIGVGVADRVEDLAVIQKPGCAAVVWRRQPAPEIQAWLDGLDPAMLPKARMILRPDAIRETLVEICETHGLPDTPERAWLIEDIATLAAQFNTILPAPWMRLRMDVVTSDLCRKFHIDSVIARLICTYRGTGTQYGISTDGQEPKRVFTTPTSAPLILRGKLWPEPPASGLLHRSPPIAGTGETRFMLVLDPVFDLEDEH